MSYEKHLFGLSDRHVKSGEVGFARSGCGNQQRTFGVFGMDLFKGGKRLLLHVVWGDTRCFGFGLLSRGAEVPLDERVFPPACDAFAGGRCYFFGFVAYALGHEAFASGYRACGFSFFAIFGVGLYPLLGKRNGFGSAPERFELAARCLENLAFFKGMQK